jgi:hypothetical protein
MSNHIVYAASHDGQSLVVGYPQHTLIVCMGLKSTDTFNTQCHHDLLSALKSLNYQDYVLTTAGVSRIILDKDIQQHHSDNARLTAIAKLIQNMENEK